MEFDFIEYLTEISPQIMYWDREEGITALYIENRAGMTPTEIEFLVEIVINHLSMFIMSSKRASDVNIRAVLTPVQTKSGDIDCIVLIRDIELQGVSLESGEDFGRVLQILSEGKYPINYILSAYRARNTSTEFELYIGKLYEGNQISVMGQLKGLFERTKMKVFKE